MCLLRRSPALLPRLTDGLARKRGGRGAEGNLLRLTHNKQWEVTEVEGYLNSSFLKLEGKQFNQPSFLI